MADPQETQVASLVINKLTKTQYQALVDAGTISATELYMVPDEGSSGGASWGSITGTLSNQTDLQTALDAKQDTISNLSTIESNAANGQSAYTTISGYGDIVTHNASEFYLSTNPEGYTSNIGTITGITMNGSSKGTSGVVDLGTVITDVSDKQATLVSGTNIKTINSNSILGSGDIEIKSAPDLDNKTISKNSDEELQAIGVIDSSDSSTALKAWTGTKAEYEAITTKDSNTLYTVTDEISGSVSNAALKDLSNVDDDSVSRSYLKDECYNEWVNKTLSLVSWVSITVPKSGQANSYKYDLSSYLPDDDAQYEIIGYIAGSGSFVLEVCSDVTSFCGSLATSSGNNRSTFLFTSGSQRYVEIKLYDNITGFAIILGGYRKISK